MKLHRHIGTLLLFCISILTISSCSINDFNHNGLYSKKSIVTVKPINDGDSCFFEYRGSTLFDRNLSPAPYGNREVRAFIKYEIDKWTNPGNYDIAIDLISIDSITTKEIEPNLGEIKNKEVYGDEEIFILTSDGVYTEIIDGYLQLHVRVPVGPDGCKHQISLLPYHGPLNDDISTNDINCFELRHKYIGGDMASYDPEMKIYGETVIAFNIKHLDLDITHGEITIHLFNKNFSIPYNIIRTRDDNYMYYMYFSNTPQRVADIIPSDLFI